MALLNKTEDGPGGSKPVTEHVFSVLAWLFPHTNPWFAPRLLAVGFLAAVLALSGCHRSPRLPDPVESKDGLAYIPIDDTAFLIPEKTWLTGSARNSTDGLVSNIGLHATTPDVQPWFLARHEEMYPKGRVGRKLIISLDGGRVHQTTYFHEVPQSFSRFYKFAEQPSDQAAQGLKKYWQLYPPFDESRVAWLTKKHGEDFVKYDRETAGKRVGDAAYYELVEDGRIKYFISCTESRKVIYNHCDLYFPLSRRVMANVTLFSDDLPHVVVIADKLKARLLEFQAAGLAYRAAKLNQPKQP